MGQGPSGIIGDHKRRIAEGQQNLAPLILWIGAPQPFAFQPCEFLECRHLRGLLCHPV